MQLKSFYGNLAFLILANLLVKPFYIFGIDRTVQLRVSEGEYGFYFALYNFSILFYILLDFGLTQYNTRSVSQNPKQLAQDFFNFLTAKMGLGLLYTLVVISAALLNGYGAKAFYWLTFLVINQVLISLIFYCRSCIVALQRFRLDALLSVLDRILVIGISGILLWGINDFNFEIQHFLWAQTFAYALAALVALFAVGRTMDAPRLVVDKDKIQNIFKKSLPFALMIFLTTLFTRIDAIMLERMLGDGRQEADIYAAGFRLLDALNIIGLLFANLLFPIFSRLIKDKKSVNELVLSSFKTLFFLSSSAVILFFLFRIEVTHLLYASKFEVGYTAGILGILLLSFVPITSNYIFNTLLNASNHLRPLIYLALGAVILNIFLNLYFIPIQKAWGASTATLITQYLVGIGHILLAVRFMKIKFQASDFLRKIIFVSLGALSVFYIKTMMDNWMLSFTISGTLLLILAWSLKLIQTKIFLQKEN